MKKNGGFQFTLDVDGDGKLASTAVKRTLHLDDDDGSVIGTKIEPTTFEQLGKDFPLEQYLGEAATAALLKAEATDQLQAELGQARGEVKAREVEVAALNALLQAAHNDQVQMANFSVSAANGLGEKIKARQKEEKAE